MINKGDLAKATKLLSDPDYYKQAANDDNGTTLTLYKERDTILHKIRLSPTGEIFSYQEVKI
jgi:hypothetical protein